MFPTLRIAGERSNWLYLSRMCHIPRGNRPYLIGFHSHNRFCVAIQSYELYLVRPPIVIDMNNSAHITSF